MRRLPLSLCNSRIRVRRLSVPGTVDSGLCRTNSPVSRQTWTFASVLNFVPGLWKFLHYLSGSRCTSVPDLKSIRPVDLELCGVAVE